jgi:uncharacterized membrane protein
VSKISEQDRTTVGLRKRGARTRLILTLVIGILAAAVCGLLWRWTYAPTVGWAAAALVYSAWIWMAIIPLDAEETRRLSSREDPGRGASDLLVVLISLASLFSVAFVLVQAGQNHGALKGVLAGLALVSVALSWILLHTLFTLHYARHYYIDGGKGVNFNQDEDPRYTDFAYLSFTLGMTYQVSDTNLSTHRIRVTALQHGLLSFVFGSFILATTINLIAGLSSGG